MPGDLEVVHIKQVFCFNCVCINEVPLYILCMNILMWRNKFAKMLKKHAKVRKRVSGY